MSELIGTTPLVGTTPSTRRRYLVTILEDRTGVYEEPETYVCDAGQLTDMVPGMRFEVETVDFITEPSTEEPGRMSVRMVKVK